VTEKHTCEPGRPLLLASTSRYRRELLARLQRPFSVVDPGVPEGAMPGEPPQATAARLARAKAEAVADRFPAARVIGSDQVCACDGQVLGKPLTLEANRHMLLALSGRTATFHTAVALVCAETAVRLEHVDATRCVFRVLSPADVDDYLQREPALDCAGGFKIEGYGISLCERVESTDPTAVVGLPLAWVAAALRATDAAETPVARSVAD
jgi:septum formation protein